MQDKFRDCNGCSACCTGALIGNAYGNLFVPGHKCVFLKKSLCTIYDTRPEFCRKYQCAWTQQLLPLDMKPNECGLIVTPKTEKNGTRYLEAVEIWPYVAYETYEKLRGVVKKLNTTLVIIPYRSGQ